MARTADQIVSEQLGQLMLQNALLTARLEAAYEELANLKTHDVGKQDNDEYNLK